ncbi:MAG: YhcH/YjgK/YiaL family protein [Prevotella sp.]|jgi:YhcH/YjgK/YiaL family protein|nr:YhcH/YjgK/YiaL family protein [Prevotella sp.]
MIIDDLKNLKNYESVNPLFAKVIEFLKNNDLKAMEPGKYEIEGKDLFLNLTVAKGKTPDQAVLETHDKMIDIQIPISDAETFGYTPRENLPAAAYNAEKDITKIPDLAAESYITCQPGMMAIFFPQDGHAPCITGAPEIKKAIFKVKA